MSKLHVRKINTNSLKIDQNLIIVITAILKNVDKLSYNM